MLVYFTYAKILKLVAKIYRTLISALIIRIRKAGRQNRKSLALAYSEMIVRRSEVLTVSYIRLLYGPSRTYELPRLRLLVPNLLHTERDMLKSHAYKYGLLSTPMADICLARGSPFPM